MTDALVVLSVAGAGSVAMPRRTIVDPHWEPLCYVVKVRFTATQLHMLDQLVSELRVSRAWLLRMAVHRGLPALVDDLRRRRRLGLRPAAPHSRRTTKGPRRGPRGGASVEGAWTSRRDVPIEEPRLEYPEPADG